MKTLKRQINDVIWPPKTEISLQRGHFFYARVCAAETIAGGASLAQGAKKYKGIVGDSSCCIFQAGFVLETHIGTFSLLFLAIFHYTLGFESNSVDTTTFSVTLFFHHVSIVDIENLPRSFQFSFLKWSVPHRMRTGRAQDVGRIHTATGTRRTDPTQGVCRIS